MPSVARVTLIGHLGRDPETKETPQGHSVTELAIATNDPRDKQGPPTWWRGAAWGKKGENAARYLKKGSLVFVEGEVNAREYQAKDGSNRMGLNVNVSNITFLPNGDRQEAQPQPQAYAPQAAMNRAHAATGLDDNLPF